MDLDEVRIADKKPAEGAMKAVAFSADGMMLAGGGDDHGVTLWSRATRASMRG